jgi:hypothetical protein
MNNDYERYEFWFRENEQLKNDRSMDKLIESNNKFDKKDSKYDPNDRIEDIPIITQFFI